MIFLLFLSLIFVVPALGQDEPLVYGAAVVGSLSESPLASFTFTGTAGDLVSIEVIGITAELDPAVSLNSPAKQQLAYNDDEAADTTDAHIAFSLPESGVFTIVISSETGTPGDFLLRLNGQPPPTATTLSDTPVDATLTPGISQWFGFSADAAEIVTLHVTTATPGFGFRTTVTDSNGMVVAWVMGSDVVGVALPFPPGSASYTAEITALDPDLAGQVSIFVSTPPAEAQVLPSPTATATPEPTAEATPPEPEQTAEAATATPEQTAEAASPAPEQTAEIVPTTAPVATSCSISPNASEVNVRTGPATTFDIIFQLQPSQVLAVTGTANFWFQVIVPDGGIGWVSDRVVFTSGECSSVPQVEPPPTPTPTPTPAS
jgi:hypothetical protein